MGSSPEQSILRVRDLVVGFGDQTVIDGVSLDVYRGEILGVVGASGGGKSVLMRTIIGLIHKWRGSITVFDKDLDRASPEEIRAVERRWGILFQQGALFSSLTAQENVQFPMCEHLDLSKALSRRWRGETRDGSISPGDGRKLPAELSAAWSNALRSPARSRLIPRSCFSTSRPPASTR